MLRHLGVIAVCACIVASVGCDGGKWTAPAPTAPPAPPPPPSSAPNTTVTVEFGGRLVDADAGGAVANVRVSVSAWSSRGRITAGAFGKEAATTGGDGTFSLPLTLPSDWTLVYLKFTGPDGYDDREGRFEPNATPCAIAPCWAATDRPTIRMYPTLVIRPGESIQVRVDADLNWCGHFLGYQVSCRRVLVAASPGGPVELEIVRDDNSKPMALMLEDLLEPDMSVRRLMVPPGGFPYVLADLPGIGAGTARLTARR